MVPTLTWRSTVKLKFLERRNGLTQPRNGRISGCSTLGDGYCVGVLGQFGRNV